MYAEDSFFTLSLPGQIGLVVLSLMLAISLLGLLAKVVEGYRWYVRLGLAILFFFAFIWLSPQIYYFYYVPLLNLQMQLVIQDPPTPITLIKILLFQENANLSFHAQGVLGWLLFLVAALKR